MPRTTADGISWATLARACWRSGPSLPPDRAKAAWHELYAAEGSDWFWWYGDDFDTAYKEEFDRLFRIHLRNVWTLAGLTPPDLLNQPLCEARRFQTRDQVTQPLSLLRPTIDGLVTNFFEWRGAGTINPNPPLGAMWKAEGLFSAICFRLRFGAPLSPARSRPVASEPESGPPH